MYSADSEDNNQTVALKESCSEFSTDEIDREVESFSCVSYLLFVF